jgi:glucose-fructose oxidoreductase
MSRRSAPGQVRYAVVGLGYISQAAVLPAFAHAKGNSTLSALVSDDPRKLQVLGKRYGVRNLASYDEYDALLQSGEVDAVYIALPNTMHRDYTVQAARRGVHVLCEKPLAASDADCRAMVEACRRADVRLMTAYRLHFEPANLAAIEAVNGGKIGEPRLFTSTFCNPVTGDNIRLDRELGGGTLFDIGIYCINAARHLFRAEPEEVFAALAQGSDKRFREVEESACVVMRFPGERIASFTCSFGADEESVFQVVGTKGKVELDMAYEISAGKTLTLAKGSKRRPRKFAKSDQFAPELVHFSDCVLSGRDPIPDGEEGLRDVAIINALYKSARIGRPVRMDAPKPGRAFTRSQEIRRPPIRKVPMVRAAPPSA